MSDFNFLTGTDFQAERRIAIEKALMPPTETLEEYKARILSDHKQWNLHTAGAAHIRKLRWEIDRLSHDVLNTDFEIEELQALIDRAKANATPKDLVQEGMKIWQEERSYRAYCNEYGPASDWLDGVCSEITCLIYEYRQDPELPRHIEYRLKRIEADIDCMSCDKYEETLAWLREGLYMPICDMYKEM